MSTVAVIGSGAWATVSSMLLSNAGHSVVQWVHRSDYLDAINNHHINHLTLPNVTLPVSIRATMNVEELNNIDHWVVAIPASFLPTLPFSPSHQSIISLIKGVAVSTTHHLAMSALSDQWGRPIAVLSGPNLAAELASGQVGAAVVASDDPHLSKTFQTLFSSTQFRVYTSTDPLGVSYGGVLKNIYAVAAGIVDGLGFGMNAKAALMTRALSEMTRIGVSMGAKAETFYGLSGVGDLMATAYSPLSRNWQSGFAMGQGNEPSLPNRGVAEGIRSIQALSPLLKGMNTPILTALTDIITHQKSVQDVVGYLMSRDLKAE